MARHSCVARSLSALVAAATPPSPPSAGTSAASLPASPSVARGERLARAGAAAAMWRAAERQHARSEAGRRGEGKPAVQIASRRAASCSVLQPSKTLRRRSRSADTGRPCSRCRPSAASEHSCRRARAHCFSLVCRRTNGAEKQGAGEGGTGKGGAGRQGSAASAAGSGSAAAVRPTSQSVTGASFCPRDGCASSQSRTTARMAICTSPGGRVSSSGTLSKCWLAPNRPGPSRRTPATRARNCDGDQPPRGGGSPLSSSSSLLGEPSLSSTTTDARRRRERESADGAASTGGGGGSTLVQKSGSSRSGTPLSSPLTKVASAKTPPLRARPADESMATAFAARRCSMELDAKRRDASSCSSPRVSTCAPRRSSASISAASGAAPRRPPAAAPKSPWPMTACSRPRFWLARA
mmetsp:Transcript_38360/g.117894  ORF Transcript_38360/g.117894 Transcript_38360/m.117894 type:complete len:410 (+) Transcript_38360:4886-6115(+)